MNKFSIIIPTFNHGSLIKYAIESVIFQTEKNWELLIIGDGCPKETIKTVKKYINKDNRIKFFLRDKGPRNGEIYRDEVIRKFAKGKYITYLSDDDLYFSDHLELLEGLFKQKYNFVSSLAVLVTKKGSFNTLPLDLTNTYYRNLLSKGENRIPLSNGAHSRKLYDSLDFGWRTTPKGIPTDLYMWQQILQSGSVKPATLFIPTVLHFASPERKNTTLKLRKSEIKFWFEKLKKNPNMVRQLIAFSLFKTINCWEPHATFNSSEREKLNQIEDSKIYWLVKLYFYLKGLIKPKKN